MSIYYKEGYKYQLIEDFNINLLLRPKALIDHYFFKLNVHGELTIKKGYAWDGASGPAIDTKNFMRGSLIHDVLYQMIREGLLPKCYREKADYELHQMCRQDGMSRIRANLVYYGVRYGGSFAINPNCVKKVLTAP